MGHTFKRWTLKERMYSPDLNRIEGNSIPRFQTPTERDSYLPGGQITAGMRCFVAEVPITAGSPTVRPGMFQVRDSGSGPIWVPNLVGLFRNTSDQSIANNAYTKLLFQTTEWDPMGTVAASVFTAPAAGWYEMYGRASWAGGAGTVRGLRFSSGGTFLPSGYAGYGVPNTANLSNSYHWEGWLTAGQQVYVDLYQNTGAALSTATSSGLAGLWSIKAIM